MSNKDLELLTKDLSFLTQSFNRYLAEQKQREIILTKKDKAVKDELEKIKKYVVDTKLLDERVSKLSDTEIIQSISINKFNELIIITNKKKYNVGKVIVNNNFFSTTTSGGGGGGDITSIKYTNTIPMPFDVGGLKKDTTFNGVSLNNLLTQLLYNTSLPEFSVFILENITQQVEIGFQFIEGDTNVYYTMDNPEFYVDGTLKLYKNDVLQLEDIDNTGTFVYHIDQEIHTLPHGNTYRLEARNTTNTTTNGYYTVQWMYRIYYGEYGADLLTLPDNPLDNLRASELLTDIKKEYDFVEGDYKWLCYPAYFGADFILYDLDTDVAIDIEPIVQASIINEFGVELLYYCIRSTNIITDAVRIGVKKGTL